MLFKELETDRLFLKNMSIEDRDFIFVLLSNNEVIRYEDAEPLTDIQEAMVEKLGFVFTEQIEVEFITENKKYLHKILTLEAVLT